MNTRLLCIYVLSLGLLFVSTDDQNYRLRPTFFRSKKVTATGVFFDKKDPALFNAYVLGYKQGLARAIKKAHQILHLMHLMTPSGLHFSAFLLLFWPLTFLGKKGSVLKKIVITIVCLGSFLLPGFNSLKRMAGFNLLKIFPTRFCSSLNYFRLFWIVFLVDFVFGSFWQFKLSFSFSFLFLGILLSQKSLSLKELTLSLYAGQLISSFFMHTQYYLAGPILGMLFTFFFGPYFILSLILKLLSIAFDWKTPLIGLYSCWSSVLQYLAQMATFTGMVKIDFFLMSMGIAIALLPKKRVFYFFAALIFYAVPLRGISPKVTKNLYQPFNRYVSVPNLDNLVEVHYFPKGIEASYHGKINCQYIFKEFFWELRCQKKLKRQKAGSRDHHRSLAHYKDRKKNNFHD